MVKFYDLAHCSPWLGFEVCGFCCCCFFFLFLFLFNSSPPFSLLVHVCMCMFMCWVWAFVCHVSHMEVREWSSVTVLIFHLVWGRVCYCLCCLYHAIWDISQNLKILLTLLSTPSTSLQKCWDYRRTYWYYIFYIRFWHGLYSSQNGDLCLYTTFFFPLSHLWGPVYLLLRQDFM